MANKRLSLSQIEQMKKMVVHGTAPEDIANHFGVAISSVHNYKTRFKEQGVVFPSVRGQRPTGNIDSALGRANTPSSLPAVNSAGKNNANAQTLTVVVNGVSVNVNGNAKEVIVNKDRVQINY